MSQSAVRLHLAEEEALDLKQHTDQSLDPDVSPLILISSGMDIEEQQ